MATFRKRNDKWQARVQRSGQTSLANSFNTQADAIKWARNVETQPDLRDTCTQANHATSVDHGGALHRGNDAD